MKEWNLEERNLEEWNLEGSEIWSNRFWKNGLGNEKNRESILLDNFYTPDLRKVMLRKVPTPFADDTTLVLKSKDFKIILFETYVK